MEAIIRSTAWSLLRGLRSYGNSLLTGQFSICMAVLHRNDRSGVDRENTPRLAV
jgi:hypothetical protein